MYVHIYSLVKLSFVTFNSELKRYMVPLKNILQIRVQHLTLQIVLKIKENKHYSQQKMQACRTSKLNCFIFALMVFEHIRSISNPLP